MEVDTDTREGRDADGGDRRVDGEKTFTQFICVLLNARRSHRSCLHNSRTPRSSRHYSRGPPSSVVPSYSQTQKGFGRLDTCRSFSRSPGQTDSPLGWTGSGGHTVRRVWVVKSDPPRVLGSLCKRVFLVSQKEWEQCE